MKNTCFLNVSFGDRYVDTQHRLKKSILDIYPDATLFFWTNEFPPNSLTHEQSYYGFKVHAVNYALSKGFTNIVWIDTCAILNKPLNPLFDLIKDTGLFVVKDDNKLHRYSGQWFKKQFQIDPNWHLVGGSIYIFDFTNPICHQIFIDWRAMESEGYFGSNKPQFKETNDGINNCGHRQDETCLAYCMYSNGVEPFNCDVGQYNQNENSIILKKHFLNPGEKWYEQ
jgi:hypothetical protein